MLRPERPVVERPRRPARLSLGRGRRISLFETEHKDVYHEHWLAPSAFDAARRAIDHAQECGLVLDRVDVSTMVFPEDSKIGLAYVANDTRTFAVVHGRVRRLDPHGEPVLHNGASIPEASTDHQSRQFPPIRRPSRM